MARVIDVLRLVAPKASPRYLAAFERGNSLLQQHEITTPDRLAHFLAQILHESGGLTLERESMKYRPERLLEIFGAGKHSAAITPAEAQNLARDERAIAERVYGLGNARKAQELGNRDPGDGFKYRGAGLMQTTGRANYRRMGLLCGVDFEKQPDLVFSAPHALKPALAEWSEAGLNVYADNALNVLGATPPLDVDGEYGRMTKDSVLQFQTAHELVAEGWAGDATHAALQLALAEKLKSAGNPVLAG